MSKNTMFFNNKTKFSFSTIFLDLLLETVTIQFAFIYKKKSLIQFHGQFIQSELNSTVIAFQVQKPKK